MLLRRMLLGKTNCVAIRSGNYWIGVARLEASESKIERQHDLVLGEIISGNSLDMNKC